MSTIWMVASIIIVIIEFQLLFHHVGFNPWKRINFEIIQASLFTSAYQI